jgi:hypothetical protein
LDYSIEILIRLNYFNYLEVTVNAPESPVIIGRVLTITWSTTSPLNGTGDLRLMLDQTTNIQIDGLVDLAKLSYKWIVNAPPGTYFWGLFIKGSPVYSNSFSITNEPPTSSAVNPTSTTSPNTTPGTIFDKNYHYLCDLLNLTLSSFFSVNGICNPNPNSFKCSK